MEIQEGARSIARRFQRRWAGACLIGLVLGCTVYVVCNHQGGVHGDDHSKADEEHGSVEHVMEQVKESLHAAEVQHPLEGLAKFFMNFAAVSAPPGVKVADPKLTTLIDQLAVPVAGLADKSPMPWLSSQQAARAQLEHAFLEKTYVDTWKSDISSLLRKAPRWDMFANNVKVVDQSGAGVEGADKAELLFKTLRETFTEYGSQSDIKVDYIDGQNVGQKGGLFVAHWFAQTRKVNVEAVTVFKLDMNNQVDTIWLDEWLVNGKEMKLPGIGKPSDKEVQKESLKLMTDVLVGGDILQLGEQEKNADGDASPLSVEGKSAVFAKLQKLFEEHPDGIVVMPVEAGMKMNMEELEKSISKAKAQVTGSLPQRQSRSSKISMSGVSKDDFVPDMQRRTIMNVLVLGSAALPVGTYIWGFLYFFVPPEEGGPGGGITALDATGTPVTFDGWLATHKEGDHNLVQGLKGDAHYLIVTAEKKIEDYAVNAVCTHLGCVVPWNRAANKFMCPCHGSQYDPTGKVVRGPAPLSLALAHVVDNEGTVSLTPWTETDFRTNTAPWWKP